VPWVGHVATSCEAVALYLKLSVWPHPLVIDHGTLPARGGMVLMASALVVVAWIVGTLWAWRRWGAVGFAGAAVLVMLAPTSSVVPVVFQPIAEHRMYLPLAVVLALAVVGGYAWGGRRAIHAGLVAAVGFAGLTVARNADYGSEEAIWRDTIAKRPDNWRAHNALGSELIRQQRIPEGIAAVETALKLNQGEAKLYNNYANALALPQVGRLPEAIAAGERAVQLDPTYADAHNSLAGALFKAGRIGEAVEQYLTAEKLKPESAEIRSNVCDVLRQAGRAAEAVVHGEEALRLKPNFPAAENNLGLALAALGRTDEAVAHYRAALRLTPDFVEVMNNLGVVLLNASRFEAAREPLAEAIRRKPDYAEAHNSLGIVLAQLGRKAEAAAEFESALRFKPDYPNARENLKTLRAMDDAPVAPRE